ncbi:MAG: hypothetical protein R2939_07125 [Kofleriaceae bacterium]
MSRAALVAVLAAIGCGRGAPAPAGDPPDLAGLAARLEADAARITGAIDPSAAARAVVAGWRLPATAWSTTVIPEAATWWPAYAAAFDAGAPALAARVEAWAQEGTAGELRAHYAGDPDLTRAQSRLRALVPLGRTSAVVVPGDGDVVLGCVFVHDGHAWRTLTGLDEAITDAVAQAAPACAAHLARAGRLDRCGELGWEITRAALAADGPALARACAQAAPHCGAAAR